MGVLTLGEISSRGDGYLEFFNKTVALPPGFYTANVRLKKIGTLGPGPIHLDVKLNGTPTRATLPVADQTPDEYVYTPDLVFSVRSRR